MSDNSATGITLVMALASAALAGGGCNGEVDTMSCPGGDRSQCITQLAVGARFGCALLRDSSTWCWGRNDENQLGYATTDLCTEDLPGGQTQSVACHTFPFQARSVGHAARVATGDAFACALRDDGTVQCWGANDGGQLGNGSTVPSLAPVTVQGLSGVTRIALGARHACAIAGGKVSCWGANDALQTGSATSSQRCTPSLPCNSTPVPVALGAVTEIVAGAAHTCARTDDGHVACWGANDLGQLGIGTAGAMPSEKPARVLATGGALEGVQSLSAGSAHTCALRSDGEVWCWGRDDRNQLGAAPAKGDTGCMAPCSPTAAYVDGLPGEPPPHVPPPLDAGTSPTDAATAPPVDAAVPPAPTDGGTGVVDAAATVRPDLAAPLVAPRAIACGADFSCALLGDGTVACWGDNSEGQLGVGDTMGPRPPTRVIAAPGSAHDNPLQGITALASGRADTCALTATGSARCWGANRDGALGIGNTLLQSGPVPLTW